MHQAKRRRDEMNNNNNKLAFKSTTKSTRSTDSVQPQSEPLKIKLNKMISARFSTLTAILNLTWLTLLMVCVATEPTSITTPSSNTTRTVGQPTSTTRELDLSIITVPPTLIETTLKGVESQTELVNISTNSPDGGQTSSRLQNISVTSSPVTLASFAEIQTKTTTSPTPETTTNGLGGAIRSASLVRPSMKQVASELSKKHLNLANENWRIRQQVAKSEAVDQRSMTSAAIQWSDEETTASSKPEGGVTGSGLSEKISDGEQEISLHNTTTGNDGTTLVGELGASSSSGTVVLPALANRQPQQDRSKQDDFLTRNSDPTDRNLQQPDHYLVIDAAAPFVAGQSAGSTSGSSTGGKSAHWSVYRRKKQLQLEENEFYQCQLYLSNQQTVSTQLDNSIQLPCTCQYRRNLIQHQQQPPDESAWLNCDHIQLIGSHLHSLYTGTGPHDDQTRPVTNKTSALLRSFSQRDSGLQVLQSQKFHTLQMSHLRAIDLSDNRLRQIKMDAFHGLEYKLEQLNLANNLLGDARSISEEVSSVDRKRRVVTVSTGDNGQLVLFNDELNRLRKLKWLSLRNNQIDQLYSGIFFKQNSLSVGNDQLGPSESSDSQLIFLDLSENLLKLVPSDAVKQLSNLETLKLNRNAISRLDEASKFPKSIRQLDLSENQIRIIIHCDLMELTNLVELDLSHNQLRQLDKSAFVSAGNSLVGLGSSLVRPSEGDEAAAGSTGAKDAGEAARFVEAAETVLRRRARSIGRGSSDSEEPSMAASSLSSLKEQAEEAGDDFAVGADDLQSEESIFSALASQVSAKHGIETGATHQPIQLNATKLLNLSHNFFEQIPGDSLLKFSHLERLDLSYNRIRWLDSNYLCSIYNLVESLRHLNLAGNLLSMTSGSQTNLTLSSRQLNRLFGCLQRLDKLILSQNRLAAFNSAPSRTHQAQQFNEESPSSSQGNSLDTGNGPNTERLVIRFGENYGSRCINTLDLSDNQLHQMPLIEQSPHQPIVLLSNNSNTGSSHTTLLTNNQSQLNQMLSSHIYLEALNLGYNYIERLDEADFEHLLSVRELHLDYNRLTALPVAVTRRFTGLSRLSVSGNKLSSIEPINRLFERSLGTLKVLNLANNRLSKWPYMNAHPGGDLDRNNYQLLQFRQPLSNVLSVPLDAVLVGGFEQAAGLSSASISPASHKVQDHQPLNGIHEIALEELNLEGNLLSSSNVSSLFDQLAYMKSLRLLNLGFNLLNRVRSEWFKFAGKSIQRLLLTGNKINTIDLGSFVAGQAAELIQLNLDFNLLRELRRKTFDSLPNIRHLSLAHNLIHTINSETFHQLPSLQVLKLNNNKLTSWKCEYFSNLCNPITGNINADLGSLLASSSNQQQQQQNYYQRTGAISLGQLEEPTNLAWSQDRPQAVLTNSPTVSSLLELDLSHNSLSQLRANSIAVHTKLLRLDLSHNKLAFIPHDLFKATTLGSGSTGPRQVQLVSSLHYLNLAHNRIQTVDNINFRPLRSLSHLDLSFNELQTLGVDVISSGGISPNTAGSQQQDSSKRQILIGGNNNHSSSLLMEDDLSTTTMATITNISSSQSDGSVSASGWWPALVKLRVLNVSNNQLTVVNQSLLNELSPFALLHLNLSSNLLDSDSIPQAFYAKIGASSRSRQIARQHQFPANKPADRYDLVFSLKLESLDISRNRLTEFPTSLLDNHHSSLESCDLSFNRIQSISSNLNVIAQIKSLSLQFNPLSRESNELVLFEQKSARCLQLAGTRLYAIQQATSLADQMELIHSASPAGKHHRLANTTSQLDLIRSISRPIEAPFAKHLNLSSNQLVWLAANVFERMRSLRTLDLSHNQLTRLHLLNNQLARLGPSLSHLNLAANLFTNIDASDFNQLVRLQHLDLSNLVSLHTLNCRFLSKLTSLRSLRMFNYPQLRLSLTNQLSTLARTDDKTALSERYHRKIRHELIMSSMGRHCFQEESATSGSGYSTTREETSSTSDDSTSNWLSIRQLELELLNNFAAQDELHENRMLVGGGFGLTDELSRLVGPETELLTLMGTNLTSISDQSLFGVASDQLRLKISYTSISRLPLSQILASVTKRTLLDLDFRNNDIQTIEPGALQQLSEVQTNRRQMDSHNHEDNDAEGFSSSLRLGSNPLRCDCHARPLWLWLNQQWGSEGGDQTNIPQDQQQQHQWMDDSLASGPANYWLKLNSLSQTSDLRCHSPAKISGKLTQHVHYNDLVCGGLSGPAVSVSRRSRKRTNETERPVDEAVPEVELDSSTVSEDDQVIGDERVGEQEQQVARLTKFNRMPAFNMDSSLSYFRTKIISQQEQEHSLRESASYDDEDSGRLGKRDHNSVEPPPPPIFSTNFFGPHMAGRYGKYKPNTLQRHAYLPPPIQQGLSKRPLLTDSDVFILSIMGAAMTAMSLLILMVCVLKYRMDQSDKKHILGAHQKVLQNSQSRLNRTEKRLTGSESGSTSGQNSSGEASTGSNSSGAKLSKQLRSRHASDESTATKATLGINKLPVSKHQRQLREQQHQLHLAILKQQQQIPNNRPSNNIKQVLVPVDVAQSVAHRQLASQNFLMRSPAVNQMHGLASNAGGWFKYTLRAYPNSREHARRRRRHLLFPANPNARPSQLTTGAHLTASLSLDHNIRLLPASLDRGCPKHGFECLFLLQEQEKQRQQQKQQSQPDGETAVVAGSTEITQLDDKCLFCRRLLAAVQQTQVRLLASSETADQVLGQTIKKRDQNTEVQTIRENIVDSEDLDEPNKTLQRSQLTQTAESKHQTASVTDSNEEPSNNQLTGSQGSWRKHNQQQPSYQTSQINSQVRQLRTFGSQRAAQSRLQDHVIPEDAMESQITLGGLNGRFAYQDDSQLEATPNGLTSEPLSNSQRPQNEVFILVDDDEAESDLDNRSESVVSHMSGPTGNDNGELNGRLVSLLPAELDESADLEKSSRGAMYQLMRSSPSATTLSSVSQNQYVVNRCSDNLSYVPDQNRFSQTYSAASYGSHNNNQAHQFERNHQFEDEKNKDEDDPDKFSVIRQRGQPTFGSINRRLMGTELKLEDIQEQIIVSRL